MVRMQLAMYRGTGPYLVYPDGNSVPISRAFEKEGLLYSDIAEWFDRVDYESVAKTLRKRLWDEFHGRATQALRPWLARYAKKYRPQGGIAPSLWEAMSETRKVEWLLEIPNPFERINIQGREDLFLDGILKFWDLRPSPAAPAYINVTDDMGSYEIRSNIGEVDRRAYQRQRSVVEEFLGGPVGHQHIVHAWPADASERKEMAAQYIELLDSGTWFLYWRQMMRSPNEVESIIWHKFLGVYTTGALERLHKVVVDGNAEKFQNKYRFIGARGYPADPRIPQQAGAGWVPDFELRSGNKGIKRDFMEDMIEARLRSGDYRGLRDFRVYRQKDRASHFDPSEDLAVLLKPHLSPAKIAKVKELEAVFPPMRWSPHPLSHNHLRNKIVAPLYPWLARLPLQYKEDVLERAQKRYAEALHEIASQYVARAHRTRGPPNEVAELREEMMEAIEFQAYLFAHRVRLDKDFERYLIPRYTDELPPVVVEPSGAMNVNQIDLGIEYSFRFPDEPRSRTAARRMIKESAEAFAKAMGGGPVEELEDAGHGHGLSIRFRYTDPRGQVWRIEWDGIRRTYTDGKPGNPRGGHIEIPSPKSKFQDIEDIARLYGAMWKLGRDPRRGAGGAHVNMDLTPLFAMEPKEGAMKLKNLIALYESIKPMVQYLWQHPYRLRVALPFQITDSFTRRLDAFNGDWNALGKLLYEERYFNPYITRKPAYVQFNTTAVMAPMIPAEYDESIDIKNPEQQWFPSFGGKGKDRVEFRLFDAPSDIWLASLQIKYIRALMDRAFNSPTPISLKQVYGPEAIARWKADPALFIEDARQHFNALGLEFSMFAPLVIDAIRIQEATPSPKPDLERFEDFLPLKED